jgi:hypothetical protein
MLSPFLEVDLYLTFCMCVRGQSHMSESIRGCIAGRYDSAADLPGVAVQLPKLARESKGGDDLRADLRDFDELLSAQQNALEVLANLCVGGGAGEEDGGGGGGAAAEWEAEIEAIVVALAEGGTANAVLTLCVPLDSGLQQVFAGHAEKGRPILSKYVQVQSRALTFLQNLLTRINAAEDVEFATTLLRYDQHVYVAALEDSTAALPNPYPIVIPM